MPDAPDESQADSLSALAHNQAMQRAAAALTQSDNLTTVLQSIVDLAAQALEADTATLATLDLAKRKVELIIQGGNLPLPSNDETGYLSASLSEPATWWALEAWRPGMRAPSATPPLWPSESSDPSPWTSITAPLIYAERVLGVFKVSNPPDHAPFTRSDQALLEGLANLAAIAVERARIHLDERSQRRQADTLREVARILNYSLDQQHLLELILDQLGRVVEYDSASIMLLDEDHLVVAAHRKLHLPNHLTRPLSLNTYPHIREAIERRRPVLIEDIHSDPRWQNHSSIHNSGCWLGVPLIGRNQVIGLLNLHKATAHFYTQQDSILASTFANQAAIGIENARLYSIERRRVDQLNNLHGIVADLSGELELTRLLHSILQRAVSLLNTTGGDLGLFDENTHEITILANLGLENDYTGIRLAQGEGLMGLAAMNRRPAIVEDYLNWDGRSTQYREKRLHTAIAMPFMIGKRIVGVIALFDKDTHRRFTTADQHLLGLLAQHAAIAVENARLFMAARQATERRNILHQVSQDIVSMNLDPEGIYHAIHQAAKSLMPAEAFVITCLLPNDSTHFEAVYLVDRSGRSPGLTFPATHGLTGTILRSGASLNIADLSKDDDTFTNTIHFGDPEEVQSILAVPMRFRGKVVGMISAQSYSTAAYNDDDQYLLEMLATYAAIALENHGMFQHIQTLATTDPLTELHNRRHLFDLGERELARSRRFGRCMGVMMLDIDHFKMVNDQHGHAIGDQVLHALGSILKNGVREIDIVGRYGGEELVIVLPEANLSGATEVAERLRREIENHFTHSRLPAITVSIGIASLEETDDDFAAIVHRADLAMYRAKQAHGNLVMQ